MCFQITLTNSRLFGFAMLNGLLGYEQSINDITSEGEGGGYKNWQFGVIFKAQLG